MRELNSIELQAVSGGLMSSKPVCQPKCCRPIKVVCRSERPETLDGRTLDGRCGSTPGMLARA